MSVESPEAAMPVEKGKNRVARKVALGVLACAAAGAIGGIIYNDQYRLGGIQQDHIAAQEGHQRCADYVVTLTQNPKEFPIVADPFSRLTASVISDCKVPGKPADYYSDPMNPNATIVTVALPSLEVLNSAAQTQERSAAAAGRSTEGMKRHMGIGALAGAVVGGVAAAWLVRRSY